MSRKSNLMIGVALLVPFVLLSGCRRTEEGVQIDRERTDQTETGARDATEGVGSAMQDATITARISSRVAADREVSIFDIDVETNDGVVTLEGTVAREEQRVRAEELARETSGVVQVENRIRVDPTVEDDRDRDDELEAPQGP